MNEKRNSNIAYLDGWRGLAILFVFIGHFTYRPWFEWLGDFGVQLFFALSGFLMADLLFIKKVALQDFFARRLSRVMPTFILFIMVMYLYAVLFQPQRYMPTVRELLATLTFVRTYLPIEPGIWSNLWPIGHIWSLNVEEHSYIYLAIGAVFTRHFSWPMASVVFLLASVIVLMIVCSLYAISPPLGAGPWFIRSECAAIGLIAAACIRTCRSMAPHSLKGAFAYLPLIWIAFAVAGASTFQGHGGKYVISPLCLALAINYLDQTPLAIRSALSIKILGWLGMCSFSLYLWQQPFFLAASNDVLATSTALVLALSLGSLSFYAFENPLREMLNRGWSKHRALDIGPQKTT